MITTVHDDYTFHADYAGEDAVWGLTPDAAGEAVPGLSKLKVSRPE
jgi:hypothetical protein